ncbi:hypothetical protein [Aestuariirhabdus sp. LZHN29]|uniref:hypothetical protein n=1 Tax=Aestuariirhabdus sp. LZHN29 TaxID=3417462 RepID=UPI003CF81793
MSMTSQRVQPRRLVDGIKVAFGEQAIRLSGRGLCCSFRQGEHFYRRTLNGQWWRVDGVRQRLDEPQVDSLLGALREYCQALLRQRLDPEVAELIRHSLHVDYDADGARYRQIYREDVPILPPDRYRDLVVQPATGCPNSRCNFCAFYRQHPFAVLSEPDFQQQLIDIKDWLGDGFRHRNGVFLGSANALALSQRRLLVVLAHIYQQFGALSRGVASFWDPDFSPARTLSEWRALRRAGVRRLVVGVETGAGSLRQQLGKSGDMQQLAQMLTGARGGGMELGLCILVGAGGQSGSQYHLQQTLQWVSALQLQPQDLIYLSQLRTDSEHLSGAPEQEPWMKAELRQFSHHLASATQAKVTEYRMEHYGYYS